MMRHNLILIPALLLACSCAGGDEAQKFLVLGDMHYDLIENHDLEWLATTKDDLRQVTQEYTVFTAENWDDFTGVLAEKAVDVDAVLQLGDISEGLAGTPQLAVQMADSVFSAVDRIGFEVPVIITKGNHDITGPGAREAFDEVYLPNMARLSGHDSLSSANYRTEVGDCCFVCYDPWDKDNHGLDALRDNLAASSAKHKFVLVHEPVIPINERCWHVLRRDDEKRAELLRIIAGEEAIVLCAHMHLYSVVCRDTEYGPIVQLMANSVIRDAGMLKPSYLITEYGPSLALSRPDWEPETMDQRVKWLSEEAEHVTYFRQTDLPGYGILEAGPEDGRITYTYYAAFSDEPYDTVDVTSLIEACRK